MASESDKVKALFQACENGNLEVVQQRLEVTDVNCRSAWPYLAMTPLHVASNEGRLEVVRVLLREGADLDARDRDGWTPLHFAARLGEVEICRALILAGADTTVKDNGGRTLYDVAGAWQLRWSEEECDKFRSMLRAAETELAKCKYCLNLNRTLLYRSCKVDYVVDSLLRYGIFKKDTPCKIKSQPVQSQMDELVSEITKAAPIRWGEFLSALKDCGLGYAADALRQAMILYEENPQFTTEELDIFLLEGEFDPDTQGDRGRTRKEYSFVDKIRRKMKRDTKEKKIRINILMFNQDFLIKAINLEPLLDSLQKNSFLEENVIQRIQSQPQPRQTSELLKALTNVTTLSLWGLTLCLRDTKQFGILWRLQETRRLQSKYKSLTAHQLTKHMEQVAHTHKEVMGMTQAYLRSELQVDASCTSLLHRKVLPESTIQEIQSLPDHQQFSQLMKALRESEVDPWFGLLYSAEETGQAHVSYCLKETLRLLQNDPTISAAKLDKYFRKHRAPRSFSSKPGTEDPLAHSGDSSIPINLKNTDPQLVLRVKNNPEDYYQMSVMPRGFAVILNNEHFKSTKFGYREGSSVDERNLEEVFHALGFEVKIWKDLTALEITTSVDELRKLESHKNADAFVFIALSHGSKGAIFGVDGKPVDITEEIINLFDGKRCPQLIDKPKLFFIQACQGEAKTIGVPRPDGDESDDENAFVPVREPAFLGETDAVRNVHEKADILVFYATVPGYVSWRDPDHGSWFMRELVVGLNKYAHELHISDILTKVNKQLNDFRADCVHYTQVGEYVSRLRKFLYFLPETDSDPHVEGSVEGRHLLPLSASAPSLGSQLSKKDCYKMGSNARGWMLIVNNVNFAEGLPMRHGSNKDRDRLKNIFEGAGFKTDVRDDLTKEGMLHEITLLAECSNELDMFDSIAVAVLSHGQDQNILGVNGQSISVEEIIQPFSRTRSPKLAGKPKLFILQVCHSRDYYTINPASGPSSPFEASGDDEQENKGVEEVRKLTEGLHVTDQEHVKKFLNPDKDMLIACSTFPGQVSHDDDTQGTCYIQSLCSVFETYSQEEHVMDMLVKINDEITKHSSETNVQCPQPTTTLTKKWYLKPLT